MRRYVILCAGLAGFVIYYGIHAFRYPWVGDIHVYIGAVHALYVDPWLPKHEAMAVEGSYSVWYSPYIVLIAIVGKMLQVSPYRALQLAGVANLLLYAGATVLFFRTFASNVKSQWPPLIFLAITLFLRSENYGWSSETSHQSMRLIQAYPSLFGWSLALIAFVLVERVVRGPRRGATLAALAILISILLLSHSITATWVIGIVGLRGLYAVAASPSNRREMAATAGKIVAAIVAGVGLGFLWPYYSLFLLGSEVSAVERSPFGSRPIYVMLAVYAFALLAAVPALRAGRHRFWVVAFVATTGAWAVFRATGIEHLDRYVFFMAFFAQVIVADAASLAIERVWSPPAGDTVRRLTRIAAGMYLVALCAAILWSPTMRGRWGSFVKAPAILWRNPASDQAYYDKWGPFRAALKPGDVVMMPTLQAGMNIAAVTGARMVAVPFAETVPDFPDRIASIERFFSAGASAETRLGELKRWQANKIVLIGPSLTLAPEIQALFGEPIWRGATAIAYDAGR